MGAWSFTQNATAGGRFQLVINKMVHNRSGSVDASVVRGAPTQFDSFTDADPFGDSTAQFTFPAITAFDDLDATDLGRWLGYYSNVDLYWVPAVAEASQYPEVTVVDPLSGQRDIVTPVWIRNSGGTKTSLNKIKVWEGFLTAMDFTADESNTSLQITCQGALFQLDRYLQKPFYPPQPWPLEKLIEDAINTKERPPLRVQKLKTQFPAGWKLIVPPYSTTANTAYTPVAKPGSKWSGYTSRQTGSWDHTLTGFIQDQLNVMLTDKRSGVTTGNQWTIQQERQSAHTPGRQPVLLVRNRYRTPDFTLWVGTPGVSVHLSGDTTQSENVIYGDGTALDGTVWRNAVISTDGTRTDYLPLAAARDVYPAQGNKQFVRGSFQSEAYTKYGTGFDQADAISSAEQALARDRDPGWTGTITLKVDPSTVLPRWLIRAGMTVLLKGFAGAGDKGLPLHISSRSAQPMQGTVELTVDSRYRDLLTVEEAQSRTRDPLTPVKMLQVGRSSVMIEDLQAPWDYTAGSGFIPTAARYLFANKPRNALYPYVDWVRRHPPLHYPSWYIKCPANASTTLARWAGPHPVLTSEKDSIIRTEITCVDVYGRPCKIPFHVSFYYVNTEPTAMPHLHSSYSAYQLNAFEKVDPTTGVEVNPNLWPDPSFIQGWGNVTSVGSDRAGFWPGRESAHAAPTGLLVDDATWSYDLSSWRQYFKAANPPGSHAKNTDISLYVMIYAEHTQPVYFVGRLFRQNPGVS